MSLELVRQLLQIDLIGSSKTEIPPEQIHTYCMWKSYSTHTNPLSRTHYGHRGASAGSDASSTAWNTEQ